MIRYSELEDKINIFINNVFDTYNVELNRNNIELQILENDFLQVSVFYKELDRWFTTEIKI